MKTKITAFIITVVMLFSLCAFSASAYDGELLSSITENYDRALALAGRGSFHGRCNLATAYQLQAMGIYDGGLDYSGTGDSWYDYFKDVSETSGGYKVVTVSGSNCIYDLVSKYGNEIYNVVYSLGTGGSSGSKHVLYIRAIIDGYVYFADSFGTSYYQTYYSEGEGTVLSISDFVSEYKRMNGNAYGCVYFSTDKSEHLAGSVENPADWADSDKTYTAGKYVVTATMLRIRDIASTYGDTLDMIPNGENITVTDIRDNWGKVEYNGVEGWVCLTYTLRLSAVTDSVSVISDKSVLFIDDTVTWTAIAEGESSKYFYSFYIYKGDEKIYSGTFSSSNTLSFTPDAKGAYKACVTVKDADNNVKKACSGDIYCLGEELDILKGDVNGDGVISALDTVLSSRMALAMETITGKNFICSESEAKKLLRQSIEAEEDTDSE